MLLQKATQEHKAAATALHSLATQLRASRNVKEQLQLLMRYADKLPGLPESAHTWDNRVMGCTAQASPSRLHQI